MYLPHVSVIQVCGESLSEPQFQHVQAELQEINDTVAIMIEYSLLTIQDSTSYMYIKKLEHCGTSVSDPSPVAVWSGLAGQWSVDCHANMADTCSSLSVSALARWSGAHALSLFFY